MQALSRADEAEVRDILSVLADLYLPSKLHPFDPRVKRYRLLGDEMLRVELALAARLGAARETTPEECVTALERVIAGLPGVAALCHSMAESDPVVPPPAPFRSTGHPLADLEEEVKTVFIILTASVRKAMQFGPMDLRVVGYVDWILETCTYVLSILNPFPSMSVR
jgi:hypothetical protein